MTQGMVASLKRAGMTEGMVSSLKRASILMCALYLIAELIIVILILSVSVFCDFEHNFF
jgi:hypothetical protein